MIRENTTSAASFTPATAPNSGAFVGGINKKKKKTSEEIKEVWIQHRKPQPSVRVPQMGTKGTQTLYTYPSSQQDSASDFWRRMMHVSSRKTFK